MNYSHMSYSRVIIQGLIERGQIRDVVFGILLDGKRDIVNASHFNHPVAISAVDHHQQFPIGWKHTGNNRFDAKCSAALHDHRCVIFFGGLSDLHQSPGGYLLPC